MPNSVVRKPTTLKRALAEAVSVARERQGLTQIAVASAAGTSQSTIGEIEGQRGNPTLDTIDRIAEVLGLEVSIGRAA